MKLHFPGDIFIKKQKEKGEGGEVRETRHYISRVNAALLPLKPTRAVGPVLRHAQGCGFQLGPTIGGSGKGPAGGLEEGERTQGLRTSCLY